MEFWPINSWVIKNHATPQLGVILVTCQNIVHLGRGCSFRGVGEGWGRKQLPQQVKRGEQWREDEHHTVMGVGGDLPNGAGAKPCPG